MRLLSFLTFTEKTNGYVKKLLYPFPNFKNLLMQTLFEVNSFLAERTNIC